MEEWSGKKKLRPASLGRAGASGMQTTHPATASGTQSARMTEWGSALSQAAFWNLILAALKAVISG
jgi:hypothetical protein